MRRGRLFAFSRFFVRRYIGRWQADVPERQGPAVYVCSHTNLLGPLAALCWLPFPVRPWVYHVFMEKGSCRAQYRDFTFPKRFGMPGPLAGLCAWASAGYVSRLMASLGGIPVYRGSRRIIETFRETIAALQAGDPVLIFPDVDYTSSSTGSGAGFPPPRWTLCPCAWRQRRDGLSPDRRCASTAPRTGGRSWSGCGRPCGGRSTARSGERGGGVGQRCLRPLLCFPRARRLRQRRKNMQHTMYKHGNASREGSAGGGEHNRKSVVSRNFRVTCTRRDWRSLWILEKLCIA